MDTEGTLTNPSLLEKVELDGHRRLQGQLCSECGAGWIEKFTKCPECLAELLPANPPQSGVCYASTTVRLRDGTHYTVGLVDLDFGASGTRVFGHISSAEPVPIGSPVRFVDVEADVRGAAVLVFEPT